MTFKVLVTCPPMLKQIKNFDTVFKSFNIEYTAPTIIQTMSIDVPNDLHRLIYPFS